MLLTEDNDFRLATEGLLVRKGLERRLPSVDTVIFDIDGVLIDAKNSFRKAVCDAVQFYFQRILKVGGKPRKTSGLCRGKQQLIYPEEIDLFKMAGGFNCDRALTEGVVVLFLWKMLSLDLHTLEQLRSQDPSVRELADRIASRGGGLGSVYDFVAQNSSDEVTLELKEKADADVIRKIFLEFYSGREYCKRLYGFEPRFFYGKGRIFEEKVVLDPENLKGGWVRFGILSGRTPGELDAAIDLLGIRDYIQENAVVADDGSLPTKPDPSGLVKISDELQTRSVIYVGDAIDDLLTVRNFKERRAVDIGSLPQMEFCYCLTGSTDLEALKVFKEKGSAVIARDVNVFLKYLRHVSKLSNTLKKVPSFS